MKNLTLTLTLTVTYRPRRERAAVLRARLVDVVMSAVNQGTLTGGGPAEVTRYHYSVKTKHP